MGGAESKFSKQADSQRSAVHAGCLQGWGTGCILSLGLKLYVMGISIPFWTALS